MEQHPVINEEEDESSRMTEESGTAIVIEESKLSTSEIESVPPTDMTAGNFSIQQPTQLFNDSTIFEFNVFLYSKYQDILERAERLSQKPADETKPFEFKYQARDLLQDLLKKEIKRFEDSPLFKSKILKSTTINQEEDKENISLKEGENTIEKTDLDLVHLTVVKGQILYLVAVNMFESEEYSDSEKHLKLSLEYFNSLPKDTKIAFCNTIQDIYNHMGIIHCSRDNHSKGLPYFAKAEQIYELVKCIKLPCPNINNNLKDFLRNANGETQSSIPSDTYSFNGKIKLIIFRLDKAWILY